MVNGKPMLWTSKGHLPYEDLVYESGWEEDETYIKFKERWTHNGEEVKSNAHVYIKKGIAALAEQERM